MGQTYDRGDSVRITAEFRSLSGTLTDPTTVVFKLRSPRGAVTRLEYGVDTALVRESVGRYYSDVDLNLPGTWCYRWEGTGTLQAAEEGTIVVEQSNF